MQKQNFKKALGVLRDMKIVLFLSDNQLVEGILLDVKQDHLVVNVNQDVFYFALEHIQGLSKNSKDFRVPQINVHYLDKESLADVLTALQYTWVSINSLGKQAFFGILSKISEDHIILIDKMEQLYIQKSYISNIYKGNYEINERDAHIHKEPAIEESSSNLTVEPKYQLESSLEEEIEEVIAKQVQITNKSESEMYVEKPINVKLTEVETDSLKISNELLETHLTTEIIKEHNLLQLDTQDSLVKSDDNKRYEKPIHEIIIQDMASRMNDELKQQEIQVIQHEDQVMLKPIQSKKIKEAKKHVETPVVKKNARSEIIDANVTNESLEVDPKTKFMEKFSLSHLDKPNFMNMDGKNSHEVDHKDILKSNNSVISEEQYTLTNPRLRYKRKRKLITKCCTIKNNTDTISRKKIDEVSEFPAEDYDKVARRSKRIKSLIHPTCDNTSKNKLKSDKNFDISGEKPKLTETNTSPLPLSQINPKEEKAILEKQYYALMKHASRNTVEMHQCPESSLSLKIYFLPVRQICHNEETMIKKQYYSLMKHAEKMYYQLKEERLKSEM